MFPPIAINPASSASSSAAQSWNFNPNPVSIAFTLGLSSPVTTLTVAPPQYAALSAYNDLSNFRIELTIVNSTWLKFANGTSEEFQIINSFSFDKDLILNDPNTLAPGNYTQNIEFKVLADDAMSVTHIVETKYKQVGLVVQALPELAVSQNAFSSSALLSSSGTSNFLLNVVSSQSWTVQNADAALNFNMNGASGDDTLSFNISNTYTFSSLGAQVFEFDIVTGALTEHIVLTINVISGTSSVSIEELNISQVNGSALASGQFEIVTSENYTITAPIWLELNAYTGNSSGPINWAVTQSANGTYTGNLTISFDTSTVIIPVTYIVSDLVDLSNFSDAIHYTRDNKFLLFSETPNYETYIRLTLSVTYGYLGSLETKSGLIQELAFYNGACDFDLGVFVEYFFAEFKEPSEMLTGMFDTTLGVVSTQDLTTVSVQVEEVEIDSNTIINTLQLPDFKFVRGNKKTLLLNSNNAASSFAKSSYKLHNFILTSNQLVKVFNGSEEIYSEMTTLTNFPRLCTLFIPKDSIDKTFFSIEVSGNKSYYTRIPGLKNVTCNLYYLNEHNLPEIINCTGGISVDNDYKYNYRNTSNTHRSEEVSLNYTEELTISINTGFITEGDKNKLYQLLKNELVYLERVEMSANRFIQLNPINQKLKMVDTEGNLTSFSFKFNISKRDYDGIL